MNCKRGCRGGSLRNEIQVWNNTLAADRNACHLLAWGFHDRMQTLETASTVSHHILKVENQAQKNCDPDETNRTSDAR